MTVSFVILLAIVWGIFGLWASSAAGKLRW